MHFRADNFDFQVPAWVKNIGSWMRDVVDFCVPGVCPGCREACAVGEPMCAQCKEQINALAAAPFCFFCGQGLAYDNAPCPHCRGRGVPHYERIIRLAKFETPIRALILQLKYHGGWIIGDMLADRLLAEDHVESLLLEADCLLPVPLHGIQRFFRGYNQAEVVAERIGKLREIPVINPVARVINTQTQTHLHSRANRMANLKGAFELRDPDAIKGLRVIVIDDVMTTGATLRTLARALRPAKPLSLSALVIAVAEGKKR